MIKIGIDIMGGDFAPVETTLGAIAALRELPAGAQLILIGDKTKIVPILAANGMSESDVNIVHTDEVIEMADSATKSFQQKPKSSIAVGFHLLKEKKIDAFASAGNSGAMLVGCMFSVKTIPGIFRPAISSTVPKEDGSIGVILDIGANADCKPEILQQFGIIGSCLAEFVYHIANPRIGLMNIGEEEEKGNLLTKEAHQLLKTTKDINFIGNIEGRDMFNNKADVIVCDGFTGNVILKLSESFHDIIIKKNINDPFINRFDFEDYGGTPVLGINGNVIIAHGISKAKAIKNMILLSKEVVEAKLSEKIAHILQDNTINQTLPQE